MIDEQKVTVLSNTTLAVETKGVMLCISRLFLYSDKAVRSLYKTQGTKTRTY